MPNFKEINGNIINADYVAHISPVGLSQKTQKYFFCIILASVPAGKADYPDNKIFLNFGSEAEARAARDSFSK